MKEEYLPDYLKDENFAPDVVSDPVVIPPKTKDTENSTE